MIKTYKCPIHGEFDHECKMNDSEIKICCKTIGFDEFGPIRCMLDVKRVFKVVNHSWKTEGFAGKGF